MKKIREYLNFHNWPLFIHLFLLITSLFVIFILLLQCVSYGIFNNFYIKKQINSIQTEIVTPYINDLNNGLTTIDDFNRNNVAYSAIYNTGETNTLISSVISSIDITNDGVYTIDGQTKSTKLVIFVNTLNSNKQVITIFSIQSTSNMLNTLSTYNFYIYAFIFIIIILLTYYISKIISEPIENITKVAKDISNLDFSQTVNENQNKETKALSQSINALNLSLKETIDELNIKNQEATELALKQQEEFKMKKQFVSVVSHELKTPLAIMQASISGIIDGVFDEKESEAELQNVLKEINHTNEMVQEVLDVYRLDNDSFSLELESLDIVYFTQKIINSFETVLKNANAKMNFFYDEKNIHIIGDYRQLKRVISNLFVNAIKYSPEYQTVQVSIKRINEKVLFEVSNYGVNIPEEDIDHVFEPFYRVDKTGNRTEKRKGSGLGLYLVREILTKHQYEFGIKNIENGVTFYFLANEDK